MAPLLRIYLIKVLNKYSGTNKTSSLLFSFL